MIEEDRMKWEEFARSMKLLPEQYADAKEELERIADDERRKRQRRQDQRLLREVARPMGTPNPTAISADEGEYVAECVRILSKERAWTQDYATDVCHLLWKEFGPGDKQERLDELLVEESASKIAGGLKRVSFCGRNTVEGVMIPWHTKAIGGAYFTPRSDLRFAPDAPVMFYQHGRKEPGVSIGHTIKQDTPPGAGTWLWSQLQLRDRYEQMIRGLIQEGKLAYEPGVCGVQFADDGAIRRATIPEVSLVPVSQPRLGSYLTDQDLQRMVYHAPGIKAVLGRL